MKSKGSIWRPSYYKIYQQYNATNVVFKKPDKFTILFTCSE